MPLPCDVVLAGPVPLASLGKGFPASHSFHEPLEPRLGVDLDTNWNLASLDAWWPFYLTRSFNSEGVTAHR